MAEGFVTLASTLRKAPASAARPAAVTEPVAAEAARPIPEARREPLAPSSSVAAPILEELARMRLAAREAFERSTARLLAALADDVLARELRLAECDLAALAARVLAAAGAVEPVALVVGEFAAGELAEAGLPIRHDAALGPADLIVEVRDGTLESPLAFRLAGALAASTAPA